MKNHLHFSSISVLFALFVSLQIAGQPCNNGISTNPSNPINNQFVQMGNDFYPGNGTDTSNPLLNSFDWYFGNSTIQLFPNQVNWTHFFSNFNSVVNMQHPFGGSMPSEFQYLRPDSVNPEFRDFRWEDGWELLYMNLGYFPDMNPTNAPAANSYYANHSQSYDPIPSNIPYFVLYNRYRGLLRLFANVWYPIGSNYEDIDVSLRFTFPSRDDNKLSGILRNASAYDLPLSEATSIVAVHAPRFHAPNYTQWIVADFQMAYDPCSCQSQGEIEFVFTAFDSLNVDIIGRSLSLDVPINNTNYTTRNFLNLSNVNTGNYEPGTEIYQNLDSMLAVYERQQMAYLEQLEEYNEYNEIQRKLFRFGVKTVVAVLTKGLSEVVLSDSLATVLFSDDLSGVNELIGIPSGIDVGEFRDIFSGWVKEKIADSNNTLLMEVYGPAPSKPKSVAIPVATLEESVYKGTIVGTETTNSSPMVLPGSVPQAYPSGTSLEPQRIPVYNEVLGQVALLNYPDAEFYYDSSTDYETLYETDPAFQYDSCYTKERTVTTTSLKMRLNDLNFALNPSLDFDMGKTQTYARVEVEMVNHEPREEFMEATLHYSQFEHASLDNYSFIYQFPNSAWPGEVTHTIKSDWIALEDLNQYEFSFLRIDSIVNHRFGLYNLDPIIECQYQYQPNYSADQFEMDIASIKIKVMHDFYFDQVGTSNDQVNVLQVYTYKMFDSEASVNNLNSQQSSWSDTPASGVFDQYIIGAITLGDETITTSHPLVHEVIGDEIFINAQEVLINGPLQVQEGYTAVIQALERIHLTPDAVLNPKIHLRIKKDFYPTAVFEYADNTAIQSFCDSALYQANVDAAAISTGLQNQEQAADYKSHQERVERGSVTLYPNPARDLLTLRSSHLDMSAITIHDLTGRPIKQQNLQAHSRETQINLSGIAPGTYIVRVDCGDEVFSEKLVVVR